MANGAQRPTVLTVFGILNIVMGSFIALIALGSLVLAAVRPTEGPILWFGLAANSLNLIGAGVLIAAGVSLLHLKPWARIASIAWAIYYIIMKCVSAVVAAIILPKIMSQQMTGAGFPPGLVEAITIVSAVFGTCLGIVYPIVLIVFMFRRNVVEALSASPEPKERKW